MTSQATIWMLHGAVGMSADWKLHAQVFSEAGYATRAVDLWRFQECKSMDLQATADVLNAEAATCQGPQILIGYSMGGRIALHALLSEKSPWASAVIISAHPGLFYEDEKSFRRESDATWAALCLKHSWSDFLEKWAAQDILNASEAPNWGDRSKLELRKNAVARSFVQWSLGSQENLRPRFASLPIPVMWMTGERDQKFSAIAFECCSGNKNIKHTMLRDAGHRVPWENPLEFQRKILEFMAVDQAK